jgi:hypothetical protein
LLVDYYNFGNVNGSVFEVAAKANGVTYDAGLCCGKGGPRVASAAVRMGKNYGGWFGVVVLGVLGGFLV